jgi:hypothetical protein
MRLEWPFQVICDLKEDRCLKSFCDGNSLQEHRCQFSKYMGGIVLPDSSVQQIVVSYPVSVNRDVRCVNFLTQSS